MKLLVTSLVILILFFGCQRTANNSNKTQNTDSEKLKKVPEKYQKLIKKLEPFFYPLGKPEADEWLANFKESGQTFEQYLNGKPTLPTEKRRKIYIQPLGKFDRKQTKIIKLTAWFLEQFYNLPTELLEEKDFDHPLSLANHRIHPQFKNRQIRTGFILDEILRPNLPDDAAALISFTNEDLYPQDDFNYVFGQASLKNRVGVWSLNRLEKNADFELFLTRTLKIAIHETGHMFSIRHCTKFSCAMNGSNHIVESDKRPLDFCPEDTAKVIWMTEAEAEKRFETLSGFCLQNGLKEAGKSFAEKSKAIT